jgi:hypothetical protein
MNTSSAKRVVEFVNIQKTDSRGRVTHALVPGHKGVWYEVLIRRHIQDGTQVITTQCTCMKDKSPCKGNLNKICYHSLAAIMAGAEKTKVRVSFCETKEAAGKLANIGGKQYIVQSLQSQKAIWMIARDLLEATMAC